MLIKKKSDIKSSEITDKSVYVNRRQFIQSGTGLIAGLSGGLLLPIMSHAAENKGYGGKTLEHRRETVYSSKEEQTPYEDITAYNNFYEFGTDKYSPAKLAHKLTTQPWSVTIEGEVAKPGIIPLEDILKPHVIEERVYRMRCVERWSMVIPWVGFPLAELIKRLEPTSRAKYVRFETLHRPEEMPGQRRSVLQWPYVEGLRMDEAMHPLTILAVGLYGEALPNQNGAPLRLVVPWKYGYKSIKSIAKISFTESQPVSSWTRAGPSEYGFYSNVNPQVDHPRWSQRRERRIGDFLKRDTLLFNGYEKQVASLYKGMDLRKHF